MRAKTGLLLILLTALSTAGCLSFLKKDTTPQTAPEAPAAEPVEDSCPASAELAGRDATIRDLRAAGDRRGLELLERHARIERLERKLRSQQLLLEEAIHEVVRTRAKQRSGESRAQAASEIAEAEIALKRTDAAGNENEIAQARQFLRQASEEFDAENFGGALYLATQAKSRMRSAGSRDDVISEMTEFSVDGEQTFHVPVPLEVFKRSNFRQGPGTEFPVLSRIEIGAVVTGYATKGPWIRVKNDAGTSGWIHRSLVRGS